MVKIVKYNRGGPGKKFISWMIGTIQIFFLLLFKYNKYEIVYFTIPPLAYLSSLILKNRFTIVVFDVYPDVLKIYNIQESNIVYKLWARWNRKLFKKAHRIFTISDGMANLLAEYIPKNHLEIIPLWTGLTKAKPLDKSQNEWLINLGLENKFIVQYSGNIGYTHNVEILIQLAQELKNEHEIHFLIIGRGEKFNYIRHLVEKSNLLNFTLLPFQPDDQLIYSLAAADLGVVLLDEKSAHVSLPSKIYNLQAVGVPILGISPPDSELNKHLLTYGNGSCFQQDDLKSIIDFILELKNRPELRKNLAENSEKLLSLLLSRMQKIL